MSDKETKHPITELIGKTVVITHGSHKGEEGVITYINLTTNDPFVVKRPDGSHLGYFDGKEIEILK